MKHFLAFLLVTGLMWGLAGLIVWVTGNDFTETLVYVIGGMFASHYAGVHLGDL